MDKFMDLLKESVILQAVLTLAIWGTLLVMIVTGKSIPEILSGAANLVLGFYFGSKLAMAQRIAYIEGSRNSDRKE